MSGDKIDKKANELFYWATENPSFIEDIKALRKKYKISENGFRTLFEIEKWREKHRGQLVNYLLKQNKKTAQKLLEEREFEIYLLRLLNNHELPITLLYMVEEYLLTNNTKITSARYFFPCAIEKSDWKGKPLSEEELWDEAGLSYTKLLIHNLATKPDVKRFIDSHWGKIQSKDKLKKGQKTNRIRSTTHKERDRYIFELYYSKDLDTSKEVGGYKREKAIAKLVKDRFCEDLDWMTIRKIAHRQKIKRTK
ncbi:TPA: hypothetical protein DEW47_03095 [Patescibacteria group bacterium]|nr:MAG: hypothetical protein UT71_C0014G0009 [Parcubacteria group bacterium GW2011_GWF2_40_10]KKR48052.1 MAG: hypothetical protein UT83_C0001G0095 [Parcubacteria group bacterium GW2011_GWA2_40_143]KKR60532.1 MAG: hypothetical protein UT97_C0001G0103 [Parcubacteria group bacterium GW2011_GWC2_40_31]KKR75620.1 MAG: hypothetical protein UU18_C0001G0017 [Parcubacteria group bacterium GW2011_GWB2_40_8]KKR77492.1 MAG: hypothetical protein UU20_C0006G0006 [Parcubacteria group bacterium GW2011_GWE2_40_